MQMQLNPATKTALAAHRQMLAPFKRFVELQQLANDMLREAAVTRTGPTLDEVEAEYEERRRKPPAIVADVPLLLADDVKPVDLLNYGRHVLGRDILPCENLAEFVGQAVLNATTRINI